MEIVDYITLINKVVEVERNDKEGLMTILYDYQISSIKNLEKKIIDYVLAIKDQKEKSRLLDEILKANNLPIISDCYSIANSKDNRIKYVAYESKRKRRSREILYKEYDKCVDIINQSTMLEMKNN